MDIAELQLPTNSGIEDLYKNSNNDAAFVVQNGERFGASSVMLGSHSPVLEEKYIKAGILEIDAVEFSLGTVKSFVEAMYCGKLDITRENFREVNKICHVFNVTWMSGKCEQYFEEAFASSSDDVSIPEISFLFEEAMCFCQLGNCPSLLEICRKKVGEEKFIRLTRTYLETKSYLPNTVLKSLLGFTTDHFALLNIIRDRIRETNAILDNISRFLLLNINLVDYFEEHASIITDIFDILLEDEESDDYRMLIKLYRRVTKEYTIHNSAKRKFASVKYYQTFPNLFHSDEQIVYTVSHVYKRIDRIAAVSSNLYMVLENMAHPYALFKEIPITVGVIRKLKKLQKEKGWDPVHPSFVENIWGFSSNCKSLLMSSTGLISDECNFRVVSEVEVKEWDFVKAPAVYKFKMEPDPACDTEDSKCGFLVEVTGLSLDKPEDFDVKLVLDKERYPSNLHFHETYSTSKMHFALENSSNLSSIRCSDKPISWRGKPEYCKDPGVIRWGSIFLSPNPTNSKFPCRLVVYFNSEND